MDRLSWGTGRLTRPRRARFFVPFAGRAESCTVARLASFTRASFKDLKAFVKFGEFLVDFPVVGGDVLELSGNAGKAGLDACCSVLVYRCGGESDRLIAVPVDLRELSAEGHFFCVFDGPLVRRDSNVDGILVGINWEGVSEAEEVLPF